MLAMNISSWSMDMYSIETLGYIPKKKLNIDVKAFGWAIQFV